VNEKPILFSAPMVRAIIEGRKTMTRRVCDIIWDSSKYWGNYDCWTFRKNGKPFIGFGTSNNGQGVVAKHCPYGQPGDTLWVRETWRPMSFGFNQIHGPVVRVQFAADMAMPVMPATEAQYDATHPDRSGLWRPSIHMPRWASRITLEVTAVRVERLQDITDVDIIAEGISTQLREYDACCDLRQRWRELWDSINAERGFGWSVNPWVWVISFHLQEARNDR